MPEYRVYTLTSGNTIRGAPAIIVCDTDQEAVEQARQSIDDHDIEVWQGARCVTRLRPTDAK